MNALRDMSRRLAGLFVDDGWLVLKIMVVVRCKTDSGQHQPQYIRRLPRCRQPVRSIAHFAAIATMRTDSLGAKRAKCRPARAPLFARRNQLSSNLQFLSGGVEPALHNG
jgi:hypothetical protein